MADGWCITATCTKCCAKASNPVWLCAPCRHCHTLPDLVAAANASRAHMGLPPLPDAELAALQGRRAADGTLHFDTDTPAELLAALQNKGYTAEACRFGFASLESFYLDFLAKQAT